MNRATIRRSIAAIAVAAASACAAGGAPGVPSAGVSPLVVRAVQPRAATTVSSLVRLVIPPRRAADPRPHFVSGATEGLKIVALPSGGGAGVTTVASLAPGANGCTPERGGGRSCAVIAKLPIGKDRITIRTYDSAPSGQTFPPGAKLLGIGAVTQTVARTGTPQIVVYLDGVVGSIEAGPEFASLPADGSPHQAAFVVQAVDFGNQPIVAGRKDPYQNPISVTLAENGGSGHAALVLDGTPSGTNATLRYSTDTIALAYDGGGSPGYYDAIAFSAKGAASRSLQMAPLYLTSTSPMYASGRLVLEGKQVAAGMTVTEAGTPPSTQRYAATPTGCGGIATVTTVSNDRSRAAFDARGGNTSSASGCAIAFGDGSSAIVVPASNTASSGGVSLPGTILRVFPMPSPTAGAQANPSSLAVGPDQQLWIAGYQNAGVQSASTSGSFATFDLGPGSTNGIVAGPDGAIWIGYTNVSGYVSTPYVARLASGVASFYPLPSGTVFPNWGSIAAGPDGNLWFVDEGNDDVDSISITGAVTPYTLPSGDTPTALAAGPDGAMWIAGSTGVWNLTTTGGTFTPIPLTGTPNALAAGPDNQMWVTLANDTIASISTDGSYTVASYSTGTGTVPTQIARGPDNAMYFIESGTQKIGRIDVTTHAVASYKTPAGTTTMLGITTGPDDNVWYTIENLNELVKMSP